MRCADGQKIRLGLMMLAMAASPLIWVGCTPSPANTDPSGEAEGHNHDLDHQHDEHAEHGSTGPNGGQLIELGRNHQYHAELVEEPDHQGLTIHLLDHDLKNISTTVENASLVVTVDGNASVFELMPKTVAGNSPSNTLASQDAELMDLLAAHDQTSAKLRVTIDEVPYSGQWEHEHHEH